MNTTAMLQTPLKFLNRILRWEPAYASRAELAITIGYSVSLLISILAVYMAANHLAQRFLFNADILWLEEYLQDLLFRDVDMSSWNTPGAPNFFPEMLVYGLLRYATGSVYWGFIGFGLVKIAFYMSFFYILLSFLSSRSRTQKSWFSMGCTAGLLLTPILLGNRYNYVRVTDFWQLFSPGGHGGAVANALIAIWVVLQWLRNPRDYKYPFLLFLLSVVASLSDRLYIVWFALPAIGAVVVLFALRYITWHMVAWLSSLVLISDMIGRKIFVWLVPLQIVPYDFSFSSGLRSVIRFYFDLFIEGWYYPFTFLFYLFLVGVTVYVFVKAWKARGGQALEQGLDSQKATRLFLLLYATMVAPISFLGMALINRPEAQYFTGGNLFALFLGFFLFMTTPFGLELWSKGWFNIAAITTLLGYVGSLAISPPAPLMAMLAPANPYSELTACLDAHAKDFHGGAGIADYWQARPINVFTRKGLRIDQAKGDNLMIFQWASNQEMFKIRKHTFVLTDTPTNLPQILEKNIVRVHGQPDARFTCAGYPVLVYNDGLETSVDIKKRLSDLAEGKVDKVTLVGQNEILTDVGRWHDGVLFSTGKNGWLEFGPYIKLPSGNYRVEWNGEVTSGSPEQIGSADVSSNIGANILAHTMISSESVAVLPQGQLAVLEFSLDHDTPLIEFHFYVNESVMVRINNVVIIRRVVSSKNE